MKVQQIFNNPSIVQMMSRWNDKQYIRLAKQKEANFCFLIKKVNIENEFDRKCLEELGPFDSGGVNEVYITMKLLTEGIKVFNVDRQNLEAMEKIDINILLSDYCQPFSTIVIEFPEDFSEKKLCQDVKPIFCVLHRPTEENILLGGVWNSTFQVCTFQFYKNTTIENNIEQYSNHDGGRN